MTIVICRDPSGLLIIGWAPLKGGLRDNGRLPQRPLLITAEHQLCQLLTAGHYVPEPDASAVST